MLTTGSVGTCGTMSRETQQSGKSHAELQLLDGKHAIAPVQRERLVQQADTAVLKSHLP